MAKHIIMARHKYPLTIPLILMSMVSFQYSTPAAKAAGETGAKGAQIYCYMRDNGNDHEVSWNAAYALIKRQSNSLFKTSPKHGAVMIIEAVVQEPNNYPNCGPYLGDLFGGKKTIDTDKPILEKKEKSERYSY